VTSFDSSLCGEILPLALWKKFAARFVEKIDYSRCGKNSLLFITHLEDNIFTKCCKCEERKKTPFLICFFYDWILFQK
jgi:hypothetical protein